MDVETFVTAKEVFLRKLSLNLDQIEIDTRQQTLGNRHIWAKEREIRVTASNFGRIYKLRPTTEIAKTVESLLYSTFRGNSHTYYGQQSEEKAVKCFEINKNIKTERCGLFISKQFPYLAASPDRVLDDRSALVEIKCPSKSQDLSPEEALEERSLERKGTPQRKPIKTRPPSHFEKSVYCCFLRDLIGGGLFRTDPARRTGIASTNYPPAAHLIRQMSDFHANSQQQIRTPHFSQLALQRSKRAAMNILDNIHFAVQLIKYSVSGRPFQSKPLIPVTEVGIIKQTLRESPETLHALEI
ncbi:hypothetical protein Zmor_027148 [Zophobas morio]|uniref:YqaJ viral recombinase domain-containing protein n=1 Tax=Zophobas morio TaxID=2755281 RepID=A0AA38HMC9_9CUCU|nr:hypothetical protein Zmor_027148 [Zophobas morio]